MQIFEGQRFQIQNLDAVESLNGGIHLNFHELWYFSLLFVYNDCEMLAINYSKGVAVNMSGQVGERYGW